MRLHLLKCLQDGKTVPQRIRNYPSQSQGYHYRQAQPVLPLPHALETIWQRSSWNGNGWMRDMFKVVSSKMRNHPWQHGGSWTCNDCTARSWTTMTFHTHGPEETSVNSRLSMTSFKVYLNFILRFFLHKVVSLVRFCFFSVFSLEKHKIPNE